MISKVIDYFELTKPRPVLLVIFSTAAGFLLATQKSLDLARFSSTLLGTVLVAAGAMTLNQWMERDQDGCMPRTASRPLPAGRVRPLEAFIFGAVLAIAGFFFLWSRVNATSALLAGLTLGVYLLIYTPLKKKTSLCTLVGAIPGALPPLIGWSAAGELTPAAWVLFVILFLWQMPHFLAIAWMYRKEYAAARFSVLSVQDPVGDQVGRQILLYSLALIPVSLLPTLYGMTGIFYFFAALGFGIYFVSLGLTGLKQMDKAARLLFRTSVFHMSFLLILMIIDKG